MQQQPQVFSLTDLNGDDIQAIMSGMNELPAKTSRGPMNKIEAQIIAQLQAQQAEQVQQLADASKAKGEAAKKEAAKEQ